MPDYYRLGNRRAFPLRQLSSTSDSTLPFAFDSLRHTMHRLPRDRTDDAYSRPYTGIPYTTMGYNFQVKRHLSLPGPQLGRTPPAAAAQRPCLVGWPGGIISISRQDSPAGVTRVRDWAAEAHCAGSRQSDEDRQCSFSRGNAPPCIPLRTCREGVGVSFRAIVDERGAYAKKRALLIAELRLPMLFDQHTNDG